MLHKITHKERSLRGIITPGGKVNAFVSAKNRLIVRENAPLLCLVVVKSPAIQCILLVIAPILGAKLVILPSIVLKCL